MAILVKCPCGRTLHAPDRAAGRKGKCPGCGKTLEIPKAGEDSGLKVAEPLSEDEATRYAPPPAEPAPDRATAESPSPAAPEDNISAERVDDGPFDGFDVSESTTQSESVEQPDETDDEETEAPHVEEDELPDVDTAADDSSPPEDAEMIEAEHVEAEATGDTEHAMAADEVEPVEPVEAETTANASAKPNDDSATVDHDRSDAVKQSAAKLADAGKAGVDQAKSFWSWLSPQLIAMTGFYTSHLGDLWRYFCEFMPQLESSSPSGIEIRLDENEMHQRGGFDGYKWNVVFPEICVETGELDDLEWHEIECEEENLAWPLWSPVAGLVLSVLPWWLNLLLLGRWWVPIGIFAGFFVGYKKRTTVPVKLRFCRRADRAQGRFPIVRLGHEALILSVGDRRVRVAFFDTRHETFHGALEGKKSKPSTATAPPPMPTMPEELDVGNLYADEEEGDAASTLIVPDQNTVPPPNAAEKTDGDRQPGGKIGGE